MSKRLTIEEFIKTLKTGSSGGSNSGVLIAEMTVEFVGNQTQIFRLDKTWQEIYDADMCVVRQADIQNPQLTTKWPINSVGAQPVLTEIVDGVLDEEAATRVLYSVDIFMSSTFQLHLLAESPDQYPEFEMTIASGGPLI